VRIYTAENRKELVEKKTDDIVHFLAQKSVKGYPCVSAMQLLNYV